MSIRKRGDRWQVRVPPFPSETCPSKTVALRRERFLKERKALGELWIETPTLFGEELDRHLERKLLGGKHGPLRPASVRFVKRNLAGWQPLRHVPVNQLRRAVMEDHIRGRARVAPVSAINELQEAKAALKDAAARGQRVDPGIFTITVGSRGKGPGRAITFEDVERIAAFMPDRVGRIVVLCGTVGLRWSEATRLDETMIDFQNGRILVPEWLNKSRRDKAIQLSAGELRLLREQMLARTPGSTLLFPTLDGNPYSPSGFRKLWLPALLRAGFAHKVTDEHGKTRVVAELRFHDLRHTATSLMCARGMSVEQVAARRGDSDGGALVLRVYRHLYDGEAAGAVAVMDGLYSGSDREELINEQH